MRNGESGQYQAILVLSSEIILQELVQQQCCGAVFIFGQDTFSESRWQLAYERMLSICSKGRTLVLIELPRMSTPKGSRIDHRCLGRTGKLITEVNSLPSQGRPMSDIVVFGPYANRGWHTSAIRNALQLASMRECVMPWCAYGCTVPGTGEHPTSNATRISSSILLKPRACSCPTSPSHLPDPIKMTPAMETENMSNHQAFFKNFLQLIFESIATSLVALS